MNGQSGHVVPMDSFHSGADAPARCWFFHDTGWFGDGPYGTTLMNDAGNTTSILHGVQQRHDDEPDSEHGISDPDGHNEPGSFGSTDGPDDLVGPKSEAEDDDGATMTTTFKKWLLYRPNPFGRDQLLFCAIRIDPNDPATSFVIGANSCWPRIDANGLQHIEVHNSVMRSSSRKGADKVYVGDDRIDGRNAVIGPRRVVTEVQIHYGGSLFTVDSQARYVGRRSDFDTIFRGEPWIDKLQT